MVSCPKHRFWQLHLSTAMLLMLVAGGFIGLNMRGAFLSERSVEGVVVRGPGWPFPREQVTFVGIDETSALREYSDWYNGDGALNHVRSVIWPRIFKRYFQSPIMDNILVGLLLLFAIWRSNEFLIRRREARKK